MLTWTGLVDAVDFSSCISATALTKFFGSKCSTIHRFWIYVRFLTNFLKDRPVLIIKVKVNIHLKVARTVALYFTAPAADLCLCYYLYVIEWYLCYYLKKCRLHHLLEKNKDINTLIPSRREVNVEPVTTFLQETSFNFELHFFWNMTSTEGVCSMVLVCFFGLFFFMHNWMDFMPSDFPGQGAAAQSRSWKQQEEWGALGRRCTPGCSPHPWSFLSQRHEHSSPGAGPQVSAETNPLAQPPPQAKTQDWQYIKNQNLFQI